MTKLFSKNHIPVIIGTAFLLLLYLTITSIPETHIQEIITNSGVNGILLLIFFIWLTNIIAPLSGTPFLLVGFYLYGPSVVIYAGIAAFLASISNFWIARLYGRKIVTKIVGIKTIQKIDRLTTNYGLPALFIIRVFLNPFHDIISYLFGLTPIKFLPYLMVSTLGAIPGTLIWYVLSSTIKNPLVFTISTLSLSYVFLSIYIVWVKFIKK